MAAIYVLIGLAVCAFIAPRFLVPVIERKDLGDLLSTGYWLLSSVAVVAVIAMFTSSAPWCGVVIVV